jgi:hypothetical protein
MTTWCSTMINIHLNIDELLRIGFFLPNLFAECNSLCSISNKFLSPTHSERTCLLLVLRALEPQQVCIDNFASSLNR